MSGTKYSEINWEAERRAQQEALARARTAAGAAAAVRRQVQEAQAALPAGVREQFARDLGPVTAWLGQSVPAVGEGAGAAALDAQAAALERDRQTGSGHLATVVDIRERRRGEAARALLVRSEQLRGRLDGLAPGARSWRPGEIEPLRAGAHALTALVDRGDFPEVERRLHALAQSADRLGGEIGALQGQDQQRRYVLEALLAVCGEMGWKAEGVPALERPADPASTILLKVQTYVAGTMEFRLTLQGIQVDSPLTRRENACLASFGELSQRLQRLGIVTDFKPVAAVETDPVLMANEGLSLADEDAEAAAERT